MRISDWSSDVCSSDLRLACAGVPRRERSVRLRSRRLPWERPRVMLASSNAQQSSHVGDYAPAPHMPFEGGRTCRLYKMKILRSSCAKRTLSRSEEHTSELQSLMRISYAVFC